MPENEEQWLDEVIVKRAPNGWLVKKPLDQNGEVEVPLAGALNPQAVGGLAGGLGQPAPAPAVGFHHISATGNIEFEDYESIGANEHGNKVFRQETKLSTDDTSTQILEVKEGFGGEERVELKMWGSLREDGVLSVTMDLKFFEGATEGTTELEDSRSWNSVVKPGGSSNFRIKLNNDEDDWAEITGGVSNRRA